MRALCSTCTLRCMVLYMVAGSILKSLFCSIFVYVPAWVCPAQCMFKVTLIFDVLFHDDVELHSLFSPVGNKMVKDGWQTSSLMTLILYRVFWTGRGWISLQMRTESPRLPLCSWHSRYMQKILVICFCTAAAWVYSIFCNEYHTYCWCSIIESTACNLRSNAHELNLGNT